MTRRVDPRLPQGLRGKVRPDCTRETGGLWAMLLPRGVAREQSAARPLLFLLRAGRVSQS